MTSRAPLSLPFLLSRFLFLLLFLPLSACRPQVEFTPTPAAFADLTPGAPGEPAPSAAPQVESGAPQAVDTPLPGPVASIGGLLVVYEKAGNLWLWQAGSARQFTSGGTDRQPQLSAGAALVAFRRGAELWIVGRDGQNPRRVFGEAGAQPWQVAFAPGAQSLYFSTSAGDGMPRFDLYLLEPDADAARLLLSAGQAGQFSFAPNGELLGLVQADRVSTARMDGSALALVYQFQPAAVALGEHLPALAWLPDGSGFKLVAPGSGGRPARLMFVRAQGGMAAQLAGFPAVVPALSESFIAPDGSKVAYLREQGDRLEMHVIDASTADKAYFAQPRGKFGLLGWTPDSSGLLYWLDDPRNVWLYNAAGHSALSDVTYAGDLNWVNGDSYLFISQGELRLRRLGQPGQVIDGGVGSYAALFLR